jgi:hypothetical protein
LKHALWTLNQISFFALQCGTEREAPEGTAGFIFLVPSLLNDKEGTLVPVQRSAKQYARQ